MKRLVYLLPVVAFVALAIFLFQSLRAPPPGELPSVLIDKPAPALAVPALDATTLGFDRTQLAGGRVTVVNVFASWCVPCRAEAPQLAQLGRARGVQLFGLVWKDTPEKARAFLRDVGNPYVRIGFDGDGHAGIEWGVYGVPETFIIDGHGIVRERFVGPITPDSLVLDILPAIAVAARG
ncbi:MAG TPA: DsbE family thiol:disulfide interchange protein [Rhizomicrobium sp.]|nr:DsbE family thiol:disulfide interchange protein [Rhizomicrobium sp.]